MHNHEELDIPINGLTPFPKVRPVVSAFNLGSGASSYWGIYIIAIDLF